MSFYLLAGVESKKLTGSMQKMLLLMPSKPELKPVESQQPSIALASVSQQIEEENNKKQETEEFKPTPFSTSLEP